MFTEKGYTPLFNKYKGKHEKLLFKDGEGYKYLSNFNNLSRGFTPSRFGNGNIYTIENINLWIEINKKPYKLLSETFPGALKVMSWFCLTYQEIFHTTWADIQNGKLCSKCGHGKAAKKLRHTLDDLKIRLEEINPNIKILSASDEYENNKSPLYCECLIDGHKWRNSWSNLQKGEGCDKCAIRNNSGEGHYNYRTEKTDKERLQDRSSFENKKWIKLVYEKDNYTCQCCGKRGVSLRAHHLNGFNWFKEGRLDVNNGITLCRNCHDARYEGSFHSMYGNGDNTKEQFEEFKRNYQIKAS